VLDCIYVYLRMCIYICVCTLFPRNYYPNKTKKCSIVYMCIDIFVCKLFPWIYYPNKATKCSNHNFNDDAIAWCLSTGWVFSVSHLCIDICTFFRAGDDAENCEILLVAQGGAVPSCKLLREVPKNRFCVSESFLCVRKIVSVCM